MKFNENELPICEMRFGKQVDKIIAVVNNYYNYEPTGNRSSQNLKQRQIIHYFCKNLTKAPLWYIGYMAGGKDHATGLNSNKKVLNYIETEKAYRDEIEEIEKQLSDAKLVLFQTKNKFLLTRFLKVS